MSVYHGPYMARKRGREGALCHVKSYPRGLPGGEVIAAERSWRGPVKCLGAVGGNQHCAQHPSEG